ncbi:MAG: arylesterase [Sphingomonadales bacterium]|nr:arylesterase [Sphingomonadales bacterium]MDE2567494.1 arylesterase [Sphingomonadales bacterium]
MEQARSPLVIAALAAALALSGCGGKSPPAAPEPSASAAPQPPAGPHKVVIAFGDSLFAGYGLDQADSYPAQLEKALWARGVNATVVNAGVSGDTTAAARERLAFTLDNQPARPDLALISLGGNDMLRGLPLGQTRANLDAILSEFEHRGIPVIVEGMLAAPNMGKDYAGGFDPLYPALAKKHGDALVPFFLQPVIGQAGLMQADNIHPNAAGVDKVVAATVGLVMEKLGTSGASAKAGT